MHFTPFLYNFDLPNQVRYNQVRLTHNSSQVAFKSIMIETHEKQAFESCTGRLKIKTRNNKSDPLYPFLFATIISEDSDRRSRY